MAPKWLKTTGRIVALPVTAPAKAIDKLKDKTMQVILLKLIRYGITAIGGGLVVSEEQTTQIAGAVLTLGGFLWSVIRARMQQAKA